MKKGFIFLFCVRTIAYSFKRGLEQIVLFTTNIKLALSIQDTDGFIFSFILLPYFCYFF